MKKIISEIIIISLSILLFAGIMTCTQDFNLEETLDGPEGIPLSLSPGSAQVSVNDTLDFRAEGGVPDYTYSVISGTGTIDPETGLYTAPGIEGTEVISVKDSYGKVITASVEVIVGGGIPVLVISPSSITVYKGSTATFTATGGIPPYTFSFIAGIGDINPAGIYTAPNTTGTATVRVTDSTIPTPQTGNGNVTITDIVTNVDNEVTSVANTGGTVGGEPLDADFLITNNGLADGSENISWTAYVSDNDTAGAGDIIVDSGSIPAIASLGGSGLINISGTWPDSAGNYYIIVIISAPDDLNQINNTQASASIAVTAPPVSDIDYFVNSITASNTPALTGSAISENFTYRNSGEDNGSNIVNWTAYSSVDQVVDGNDTVIDSGTVSPLAGETTAAAPVAINGTWPLSSGVHYLIISLDAYDDVNPLNNSDSSSQFVLTSPADIDYIVTDITENYPTVTTDMPVTEYFDIANTGGLAGSDVINWTAYASLNNTTLEIGTDNEIGSGTTLFSGLPAGGEYGNILINGFWPSSTGTYYLIIDLSSADETIIDNNTGYSGPFTVKTPPDYSVLSAVTQDHGTAGAELGWDIEDPPTTMDYSFIIRNNTSGDGLQSILWKIYCSTDNIYDENDDLIQTGSTSAIAGSSGSSPRLFEDADWPDFGSYYYLIINLIAPDDISSSNNTFITSTVIEVPEIYTEGGENNNDLGPAPVNYTNLDDELTDSRLDAYELIQVYGTTDAPGTYDTYKVTLGPDATKLDIYAEWTTVSNVLNMTVWDDLGLLRNLNSPDTATEPAIIPEVFESLSSGGSYYIGVRSNQLGESYSLYIYARP